MPLSGFIRVVVVLALVAGPLPASAPMPYRLVDLELATGVLGGAAMPGEVLFSEIVRVDGAIWLRLRFEADLAPGVRLRLTSIEDGAVQHLDGEALERWQRHSAFFNGEAVSVEVVSASPSGESWVRVVGAMAGERAPGAKSICGDVDDRVLSDDPRISRIAPDGCTSWLVDRGDAENRCVVSAGHCIGGAVPQVLEFNVPLSDPDGSVNHPEPEHQYPIDPSSEQVVNSGIGNDWAFFAAFPNSETGLGASVAQGGFFALGSPLVPSDVGALIRVSGHGVVSGTQGTPRTWNQVQTTHMGLLNDVGATSLGYGVDTTGGDSGSPVVTEADGLARGIHTHGGCNASGSNHGTSLSNAGLMAALARPLGACCSSCILLDGFEAGNTTAWSSTSP